MELKVNPIAIPEAITFNFEELKGALLDKVSVYEAMVYTDEQISAAKADRANLNRLKKALNDERIKREREYMQPFAQFKAQINEIIAIVDKPVAAIDKQVKAFEDQQKAEKLAKINEYIQSKDIPEGTKIGDPKWLNASVSMKSIQEAIDAKVQQIHDDLAVIRNLPSYAFEAEQVYLSSLDLAKAVSEAHRLSDMAERKAAFEAEQQRRKEEAAARMEAAELKPTPQPEPAPAQPATPKKYSISFRVSLTVEEAKELKAFFEARNIAYEKI